MVYGRGEVWWGPAPHKPGPSYRPWVVVNDDSHPFSHTECIVLAMTSQRHSEGIAVSEEAWVEGGSKTDTYVSPWYVTTIKHRDFDDQQGTLERTLVDEAVEQLHRHTTVSGS
jgi:mRNA-degrading endonuclease toxin of MazEF toxin-antitoxin module